MIFSKNSTILVSRMVSKFLTRLQTNAIGPYMKIFNNAQTRLLETRQKTPALKNNKIFHEYDNNKHGETRSRRSVGRLAARASAGKKVPRRALIGRAPSRPGHIPHKLWVAR